MSPARVWTPRTTRWSTPAEQARAGSRLTFDDGLLVWSPSGRDRGVGSQPFSVRVGQAWGEAAELVHVVGQVAEVDTGGWVDMYAVCSASNHSGPVRVVGFLPPWIFTSVDPAEVAAVAGLGFARYVPEPGRNIDEIFPGIMPSAPAMIGRYYSVLQVLIGVVFVLVRPLPPEDRACACCSAWPEPALPFWV